MAIRSFKALAPSQMLTLISKAKFIAKKLGENAINLETRAVLALTTLWVRPGAYPRVEHVKGASLG